MSSGISYIYWFSMFLKYLLMQAEFCDWQSTGDALLPIDSVTRFYFWPLISLYWHLCCPGYLTALHPALFLRDLPTYMQISLHFILCDITWIFCFSSVRSCPIVFILSLLLITLITCIQCGISNLQIIDPTFFSHLISSYIS